MNLDKRSSKNGARADGKASGAKKAGNPGGCADGAGGERPGWASGLRQLYDAVVDEPLPDSFNDLIAKLDRQT